MQYTGILYKLLERSNHNLIIRTLSEIGVPEWLLKVVMGSELEIVAAPGHPAQ